MNAGDRYHEDMVQQSRGSFEKHQISKRSDGRWLLQTRYKKPPEGWEWTMAAEIICLENNSIYVGGDIYQAVFGHGPRNPIARVRWMGKCDDLRYYVHQKASIGMVGLEGVDTFSQEVATEDLRDIVRERIESLVEDDCDGVLVDPLFVLFDQDIACEDWPMHEDERDQDDPVDGPYHLREAIAHLMEGPTYPPIDNWKPVRDFLVENSGDDMELLEKFRPWLAEHQRLHVKLATEEDSGVCAIEETISSLADFSDSSSVYVKLQENLSYADSISGNNGLYHLAEERYHIGRVMAPRIYYAHAALRRLCELLDEEEKEKSDDC